ncbi:MAG: alpha/beta fold hydrolase [bacterium]|nr:alpha/beta fold hydrolase [bacterium]
MIRQYFLIHLAVVFLGATLFSYEVFAQSPSQVHDDSNPAITTGFVSAQGADLFFKTLGTGDPIIVLHGGPGFDHRQFLPFIWELVEGHQVILYDQRGTGLSSGAVDSVSIHIDTFVADIEAVREHFGIDQMNLIGHSWGGILAMYYALEHPDQLRSLVLCSTTASIDAFDEMRANYVQLRTPEDNAALEEIGGGDAFNNGDPEAWERFWRVWFRTYFHDRTQADRMDLVFLPNTINNCGPVAGYVLGSIGSFELHDQLTSITCPTLVMHGLADPMPSSYAQKIHQAIPGSELVLAPKVGHWFFVDGTKIFTDSILGFLANVPD